MFLVSAILHHISLLKLLPKLYFKISTFQPNFLWSSSFNLENNLSTTAEALVCRKYVLCVYHTTWLQIMQVFCGVFFSKIRMDPLFVNAGIL